MSNLSNTTDVQGGGLPTWAIAVIVISVILVAVIATVIIILYTRNRSKKRAVKEAKALNRRQMGA